MKASIIVPAHNEEKRIGKMLAEYLAFFKNKKQEEKIDFQIIVVLNACKDRTREVVDKNKCKELKILEFEKGGKGFAVIEGFKEALKCDFNLIGFVDADLATKPEAFYDLIINIENYDAIIASRYIKGAVIKPKPSLLRVVSSRIYNAFLRAMLFMPYRDTQCGAKLFKRNSIEKILPNLTMSKWAFDVDILICLKNLGLKIKEYPTIWGDKAYSNVGGTKNYLRTGFWMGCAIIRLRLLNSPFNRHFIKIYDKIMKKIFEWKKKN